MLTLPLRVLVPVVLVTETVPFMALEPVTENETAPMVTVPPEAAV